MKLIVKMKRITFAFPVLAVLLSVLLAGCFKSYNEDDVGFAKIYIPQATLSGLDNSYSIPRGDFGVNTYYTGYYKDGSFNIALGVVRAGSFAVQKGFSVSVSISQDETTAYLAKMEENDEEAIQIPAGMYDFPGSVSVEAGTNTGTFYLSVNMSSLASQSALLKGEDGWKKLVLTVQISNPTEYELNDTNTSIVVIIDLNSVYWDNALTAGLPEGAVRTLFPL